MDDVCLILTVNSESQSSLLIPTIMTYSMQFQGKQMQVLFVLCPEKSYFGISLLIFYQNSTRYCYECASAPCIVNSVCVQSGEVVLNYS